MRVLIVAENRDAHISLLFNKFAYAHETFFVYKMLNNCVFYYFYLKKILNHLFLL